MCTGAEILGAMSLAVTAAGTYATYDAAQRAQKAPVLQPAAAGAVDPVADDQAAQTKAAQEAELYKLEARRKSRANSLLSQAGGAGDNSAPSLNAPVATGKTSLGEG